MIVQSTTNSNPMPTLIGHDQLSAVAVRLPDVQQAGNFCFCGIACPPMQPVFAGTDDADWNVLLTRDQNYFYFQRLAVGDTVVMTLWKEGVQVASLHNTTYGLHYDFGDVAGNANLKGYIVDWRLVFLAFGRGSYQFKATLTLLGQTYSYTSINYYNQLWSEEAADGTVRIEGSQNGTIGSSDIDYTGTNLIFQQRVWGSFADEQATLITEDYPDANRNTQQIQDEVQFSHTLEIHQMSRQERHEFLKKTILADRLIITDYSIANESKYIPIPVRPDTIESIDHWKFLPGSSGVFKFKEKLNNNLKRRTSF